jgi:hypothetical protein
VGRAPSGRRALALATALVAAGAVAGCTPDDTRQRVEADMQVDWANQYRDAQRLQGKSVPRSLHDRVSCDKGGPKVPDRGPGKDWICMVSYRDPATGKPATTRYELFVHGEACYTATDPKLIENSSLPDPTNGATKANPLEQFDGCFSVYDGKTSTTK